MAVYLAKEYFNSMNALKYWGEASQPSKKAKSSTVKHSETELEYVYVRSSKEFSNLLKFLFDRNFRVELWKNEGNESKPHWSKEKEVH